MIFNGEYYSWVCNTLSLSLCAKFLCFTDRVWPKQNVQIYFSYMSIAPTVSNFLLHGFGQSLSIDLPSNLWWREMDRICPVILITFPHCTRLNFSPTNYVSIPESIIIYWKPLDLAKSKILFSFLDDCIRVQSMKR